MLFDRVRRIACNSVYCKGNVRTSTGMLGLIHTELL